MLLTAQTDDLARTNPVKLADIKWLTQRPMWTGPGFPWGDLTKKCSSYARQPDTMSGWELGVRGEVVADLGAMLLDQFH